jgi:hypothetical protein
MKTDILVEIIGSGVTLLGIIITSILSWLAFRESRRISKTTKIEIEISNLKEKKNFSSKKLHDFYYPLKKYLDTSKSLSEILKSGKPKVEKSDILTTLDRFRKTMHFRLPKTTLS